MLRLPMRLIVLGLAAALALVPAAASAPSAAKTIGTRGEVVSIAADGARVAIHANNVAEDCHYGSVWTPSTNGVVRLSRTCSEEDERILDFDELTLGGSRLVWNLYEFGNHAYCYGPYTATLSKPKTSTNLGICTDEPRSSGIEFAGDGSLLVARDDDTIWRITGSIKKLVNAKDVTTLLGVSGSSILLLEPGGTLVVYSSAGKRGPAINGGASGGAISGGDVVGVKGTTLTLYDAKTGVSKQTRTMAAKGKFHDLDTGLVAYAISTVFETSIRVLRLGDGRDRVVAKSKGLVDVDLEPSGLFYAHNSGKGDKPGRVTFVPMADVTKLLG